MHQSSPTDSSLQSSLAIGLMALSLFSFSGCSTKTILNAEKNATLPPVTFADRGNDIFFVPTAEGVEASRAFAEILKQNPGKEIGEIERTGRYDVAVTSGAGFIVVLQDKAGR